MLASTAASPEQHGDYLATLFYDSEVSAEAYLEACKDWSRRHAPPLGAVSFPHVANPSRTLRIGYASAHFSFHVVGRLLLPLLRHHDPASFAIHCYSATKVPDPNTQRLRACGGVWRDITDQSIPEVAEQIKRDRIDILVDTTGHFGGSLLPLFALRPAPIQVTHFGHFSTTGLDAMDYRFTDSLTDPPPDADRYNHEKLIRLDPCAYCYLPEEPVPTASPPPALANGFVTFGCLNNLVKMTDPCVQLWSRVLRAVPRSKLTLLAAGDEESQRYTRARFIHHGIDGNRLELLGKCSHEEYLKRFDRIDIALDPFPYNGDNTACDGLWCGVPLLTLAGTWSIARRGISHLTAIGMEEWIARTPDEYVAKAAAFAGDLKHLADVRKTLRQRMQASPLCDAAGFAQKVEAAYRAMWARWCKAQETDS